MPKRLKISLVFTLQLLIKQSKTFMKRGVWWHDWAVTAPLVAPAELPSVANGAGTRRSRAEGEEEQTKSRQSLRGLLCFRQKGVL